jgi:hypothetical protein
MLTAVPCQVSWLRSTLPLYHSIVLKLIVVVVVVVILVAAAAVVMVVAVAVGSSSSSSSNSNVSSSGSMVAVVVVVVKIKLKIKFKCTLEHATKAQRGVYVYQYSFFNLGARWGWWSTPHPDQFTAGNTKY